MEPNPSNIDGLTRLLERIAGYHGAAPVVWWTFVGLFALGLVMWGIRGRRGKE